MKLNRNQIHGIICYESIDTKDVDEIHRRMTSRLGANAVSKKLIKKLLNKLSVGSDLQNGPENRSRDGEDNNDFGDNRPTGMDPDGVIESNWDEIVSNFDDMNLREELLRGIYAYGFEKPSAIQQRAIIPCIKGMDVIAQAQSGTGKTATFSIAILQQIDTSLNECQALILAPTRELALQIQKVVLALGDYMNAQCHACIGGTNVHEDVRKLEMGAHIVVGTIGRVYDMIRRRALRPDHIKILVVDEADEMLARGFKDQIYDVFKTLNQTIQVILLSDTMEDEVLEAKCKVCKTMDPIHSSPSLHPKWTLFSLPSLYHLIPSYAISDFRLTKSHRLSKTSHSTSI